MAFIKNTIKNAIAGSIAECTSVGEFLEKIKSQFTGSSKVYATQLLKQLVTEKYTGGAHGIREHIVRMSNMAAKLKPMDADLDRKLPASALEFLAAKIYKQIPGWHLSLILIGGRLTLATAVPSALPLFPMSFLPLLKGVLAKMDRPHRALVWKAAAACSGGDCQVAWDFVCHLREERGLGVVDFALQNTCLLLKVLHGLLSGRDTPWTKWVQHNYLCSHPAPSTLSWRHFSSLMPLYRSITRVVPGDGASTTFWFDSWSPLGPLASALPSAFSHCLFPDATLAEAIGEGACTAASRFDTVSRCRLSMSWHL
jgi:hypothetical protein